MSASTIARWNAIPLERDERFLKRSRSPDDEDDNMSLVSRTPSPQPMDVDKYDEYVQGTPREVITVETRIKSSNKGFAMLTKLGWAEGQPLGLSGDGRVDPVPFQIKRDLTGLGKINQDVRMIETTVSQRRGLDSERQQKETEEQRRAREDTVARRFAIASEVSSTLKAFYCTLCEKQFKTVAQYDEHTNSYAHHHKARAKDVQTSQRAMVGKEEGEKRKEKERKREEKELRKIAKAAGVKMAKPPVTADSLPALAEKPSGFKKSGWTSLSSAESSTATAKSSGWATVGSSSSTPIPEASSSLREKAIVSASPSPVPPFPNSSMAPAPAFRTAGWTSLDTGSSQPFPANAVSPPSSLGLSNIPQPPPIPAATPPPPPPDNSWSTVPPPADPRSSEWTGTPAPPPSAPYPAAEPLPGKPPSSPQQQTRSGWQQFRKSVPKHR